jgi:hypothetical protein
MDTPADARKTAPLDSGSIFRLGHLAREGHVIWVAMFSSESDALEATGLSE